MFPQLRLTPARATFARPGPHATAFPDVNALMQPSDSLVPVGRRSGRPSQTAYPGAEGLFFTAAPVPPPTGTTPETLLPRLPNCRLCLAERQGSPRCLGHPLRACRGRPPRRVRPPLAHSRCSRCCLQDIQSPGHPEKYLLSRLHAPRPTRSRAYASPSPLPSPAQGSLPAGRAHPWPGGFRTRWMTKRGFMGSSHPPKSPLDQPCLVALDIKILRQRKRYRKVA